MNNTTKSDKIKSMILDLNRFDFINKLFNFRRNFIRLNHKYENSRKSAIILLRTLSII